MKAAVTSLALLFFACQSQADNAARVRPVDRTAVRLFESGSLDKIRLAHHGKPFILGFWSLDCSHCPEELKALGALKKLHPKLQVVLVSTDTQADATVLTQTAARHGLTRAEQWVFADPQPEKLRFEIDRRWWGELPRAYLFDAEHRSEAVSGIIPAERLARWADENDK